MEHDECIQHNCVEVSAKAWVARERKFMCAKPFHLFFLDYFSSTLAVYAIIVAVYLGCVILFCLHTKLQRVDHTSLAAPLLLLLLASTRAVAAASV